MDIPVLYFCKDLLGVKALRYSLAALTIIGTAKAVIADELDICRAIMDADERLACYDRIPPSAFAETSETASLWVVTREISPFDDSQTMVSILESRNLILNRIGREGPARVYLRCKEGQTNAYLTFNDLFMTHLGSGEFMDYRVDDNPQGRAVMRTSGDNMALGFWAENRAQAFAMLLLTGERLVVRVTPHNHSPITATFVLEGAEEAIAPIREACGW